MNRFQNTDKTKFGLKAPSFKLNYDTSLETQNVKEVLPPAAIWDILGISEEEYYEKYHKHEIPKKAVEIQEGIEETKEYLEE